VLDSRWIHSQHVDTGISEKLATKADPLAVHKTNHITFFVLDRERKRQKRSVDSAILVKVVLAVKR
jgi:hypothetical protein